tara:strand:- start:30984 stop:31508 length:525 start_codon:yes stop_codon:yes gene_type:complete
MILQIYKPNKTNTGHAMSININRNLKVDKKSPKHGELQMFVSVLKQSGWNDATKTGSFDKSRGNEKTEVFVKFNEFEVGNIISSLSRGKELSLFHSMGQNKTQISFKTTSSEWKGKTSVRVAFGITKNSTMKFFVPIEESELKAVIICLETFLTNLYDQRIRKAVAYQQKKENG